MDGRAEASGPCATARIKDVRRLRTMIQVRSVARRVLASAKRDLADRPETLHCGLLVLHVNRLPQMVKIWLYASGQPTTAEPRRQWTPFVCRNAHAARTVSRMRASREKIAR
jgi:hypothetical protein